MHSVILIGRKKKTNIRTAIELFVTNPIDKKRSRKGLKPAEMANIEAPRAQNWTQRRITQEIRWDNKAVFNHHKQMKTGKEFRKTRRNSKLSDSINGFLIQTAQTSHYSARQIAGTINHDL